MSRDSKASSGADLDVIVVGAGFAGLYALHRFRNSGLAVQAFETGHDVGGTWYWNRYPGARCDLQSLVYCYTFDEQIQREWNWSERYATQGEILRYLNFVADRLDLRKDIVFDKSVVSARFDEVAGLWEIGTNDGVITRSRFVVFCMGGLSVGKLPDIPGIELLGTKAVHTAQWPAEGVDIENKRVAVIGTGSSGVQVIPEIAKAANHLTVFQRTPVFVAPARNTRHTPDHVGEFRSRYDEFKSRLKKGEVSGIGDVLLMDHISQNSLKICNVTFEERRKIMEARWDVGGGAVLTAFPDLLKDEEANAFVSDFFREKIRAAVNDPVKAEKLCPKDYPFGTKRVCVGTDYYETYNRKNVELIELHMTPIVAFTETGVQTTEKEMAFDVVVFATGFDAVTGPLMRLNIRGRDGRLLSTEWADGPKSYLGVSVAGFPNMFVVTGPGGPAALSNVVVSIEQNVEWIAQLLDYAKRCGFDYIDVDRGVQERWSTMVADLAADTLYAKAKSWYWGSNVAGKPRTFLAYLGGVGKYREICEAHAQSCYPGFIFARNRKT